MSPIPKTPGHVYQLSNEHHVRVEIKLDHVENWDLNAPQTEGEAGESVEALSLEINASKNITIANYHGYRVTRSRAPFPAAVRIYKSGDIRFRNVLVNAESGIGFCSQDGCHTFLRLSKFPFESSIQDITHHLEVREREFAVLDIPANPITPPPADASAVFAPGAKVRKLEEGFFSTPAPPWTIPASFTSSNTTRTGFIAGLQRMDLSSKMITR